MTDFQERRKNTRKQVLRSFVGRHAHPIEWVSERTGISERQIQSHLATDGADLKASDIDAYATVFGPEFLEGVYGPLGFRVSRERIEMGCAVRAVIGVLHASSHVGFVVTDALADQRIDHRERLSLPGELRGLARIASHVAYGLESEALK